MEQRESSGRKPMKRRKPIRRKSRRRRRIVTAFLALLGMGGVMVTLSMTVLFQTKFIEVSGETRYSAEDIIRLSGLKTEENLFMQDRETAEKNLPVELPYLKEVTVKIQLPDQLTIAVEETVPTVALKTPRGIVLADAQNKALEVVRKAPENLPLVKNATVSEAEPGQTIVYENEQTWEVLTELLTVLDEEKLEGIEEVDLKNLYSLQVLYRDIYWIKFGSTSELREKVQLAKYVIDYRLDGNQPGYLDLSGEKGSVVFREDFDSVGVVIAPEKSEEPDENGENSSVPDEN